MSDFNFNNFNDYENIEQEIRPPDNTIREILVNDYNYYNDNDNMIQCDNDEYDNAFQLACIESLREQEELLEKTNLRVQSFKNVLLKIKKIGMIDKTFLEFYNIIEPIIDFYCACNIDIYECDKNMYDEIFKTLKTIRLTEFEFELFKNLFVVEN